MHGKVVVVMSDGQAMKMVEVPLVGRPICFDLLPDSTVLYICTLPENRTGACQLWSYDLKDAHPDRTTAIVQKPKALTVIKPSGQARTTTTSATSGGSSQSFASQAQPLQITSIAVGPMQGGSNAPVMIGTIAGELELLYPNGLQVVVTGHKEAGVTASSNCVAICRTQPWGLSAGGDGTIALVNFAAATGKVPKTARVHSEKNHPTAPLTNICFSANGEIAAVASGYDWSRGSHWAFQDEQNTHWEAKIWLKKLSDSDFR
jgi:hypothetical protein